MFSIILYVLMGWMAAYPPLLRDFGLALRTIPNGMGLVLLGGAAYTAGIPVFVRNVHLDHVVWHLFVMAGSTIFFFALMRICDPSTWLATSGVAAAAAAAVSGSGGGAPMPL